MKDLIFFLIKNITGNDQFEVVEEESEDRINYVIKAPKEIMGLIIGKEGKTIRVIRTLVKVRATLERKIVNVSLEEKTN